MTDVLEKPTNRSMHEDSGGSFVFVSSFDCSQTTDRLEDAVLRRGMQVFARIDFSEGARTHDLELGETQLLLFGNPAVGTRLLQENQRVGIDLPLKALVYTSNDGMTRLEFSDPLAIAFRYCVDIPNLATVTRMQSAFLSAAREAVGETETHQPTATPKEYFP